jgi:FG-GAP-like repeat
MNKLVLLMFGLCACTADDTVGARTDGVRPDASPRLIAPLSAQTVTSARPRLRWAFDPPASVLPVWIDVCRDPACASRVERLPGTYGSVRPSAPLAPGVYFWRAVSVLPDGGTSATWSFRVPARPETPVTNTAWGTFLDVNADGFADIAVRTENDVYPVHEFAVYMGSRAGLAILPIATVPLDAAFPGFAMGAAGDLNGDGHGDLAVADGDNVEVYFGMFDGIETTPQVIPAGRARNLGSAGDVDGDGYGDLFVGDSNYQHIAIYRGSAEGVSTTPAWTAGDVAQTGVIPTGAADFNGDGYSDLALTEYSQGGAWLVVLHGGKGGLEPLAGAPMLAIPPPAIFGALGDVDADGRPDVLLRERGVGVHVYLAGAFAYTLAIVSDGLSVQTGDFDGDGRDDLAALRLYRTDDFFFTLDLLDIYPSALAPAAVTLDERDYVGDIENNFGLVLSSADLDRDGHLELMIGSPPPYPTPFFANRRSDVFIYPGTTSVSGAPGFGIAVAAGPNASR